MLQVLFLCVPVHILLFITIYDKRSAVFVAIWYVAKNIQLDRAPDDGVSEHRRASEKQLICDFVYPVYCTSVG
jgi:hypothetical protein